MWICFFGKMSFSLHRDLFRCFAHRMYNARNIKVKATVKIVLFFSAFCFVGISVFAQTAKKGNEVAFYVRGGYVNQHTSLLPSVMSLITNDETVSYPGASLVAGFRKSLGHGWYGGMEAGLFFSHQKYSYKDMDYSTLLSDTVKYIYTDDVFDKYSIQFTPLMVGYRYDLLEFLSVDLHAGLNMRFCPYAWRSTTKTYEEMSENASGTIGWDDFVHFAYCLNYGFGLTFFNHYNVDLSARGLNGFCLSVGYEF